MPSSDDLDEKTESAISKLVEDGRYKSRTHLLRAGVRLVAIREARLARLDKALAQGVADMDAGHFSSADEVSDRLAAKFRRMAENKKADE